MLEALKKRGTPPPSWTNKARLDQNDLVFWIGLPPKARPDIPFLEDHALTDLSIGEVSTGIPPLVLSNGCLCRRSGELSVSGRCSRYDRKCNIKRPGSTDEYEVPYMCLGQINNNTQKCCLSAIRPAGRLTKLRVKAEKVVEEKLGTQLDIIAPINPDWLEVDALTNLI
ncbi:hypothetical protein PHJA_001288900 [Phtheirospermum japonicum]|uniref:Uncharacterized protein n=1 Tax=Phtheirospermum japonicum TaxID=374723 RepID=A0A830BY37_9LAMI|nr:hypothetical protein PHJA_001288900 [Phtheirospermum japonicum]